MKKTVQTSAARGPATRRFLLEVCIASPRDALEASRAGADRLELNSALELGGLTPSAGLVGEVLRVTDLPVIAMVRPRAGGFCYDAEEQRVMLRDAEALLEQGVAGIAFGALTPAREIDQPFCRELVRLAGQAETVFHRAFDVIDDARTAARCLVDLHVTRLLTSGQAAAAMAPPVRRSIPRASCRQANVSASTISAAPGASRFRRDTSLFSTNLLNSDSSRSSSSNAAAAAWRASLSHSWATVTKTAAALA